MIYSTGHCPECITHTTFSWFTAHCRTRSVSKLDTVLIVLVCDHFLCENTSPHGWSSFLRDLNTVLLQFLAFSLRWIRWWRNLGDNNAPPGDPQTCRFLISLSSYYTFQLSFMITFLFTKAPQRLAAPRMSASTSHVDGGINNHGDSQMCYFLSVTDSLCSKIWFWVYMNIWYSLRYLVFQLRKTKVALCLSYAKPGCRNLCPSTFDAGVEVGRVLWGWCWMPESATLPLSEFTCKYCMKVKMFYVETRARCWTSFNNDNNTPPTPARCWASVWVCVWIVCHQTPKPHVSRADF